MDPFGSDCIFQGRHTPKIQTYSETTPKPPFKHLNIPIVIYLHYDTKVNNNRILYLTIKRHPEELRNLIRTKLRDSSLSFDEVEYEDLKKVDVSTLSEVSAVLLAPARYIDEAILQRLKNCKLIQIWSSGYDKFNLESAKQLGLKTSNNGGTNSRSVAEHTMNMILGISRRNIEMHQRVISGLWAGNDHGMSSHSLNGKTLGLVGYGKVAKIVEELALAFKMNVIFNDIRNDLKDTSNFRTLEILVQESDYISLHLHLNVQTKSLIDERLFKLMNQRKPYLINVSRAELIDEEALEIALDKGQIRGLGMDVHYAEPNHANSKIYSYENTLFSPHVAGSTIETYSSAIYFCVENILRALRGEEIKSVL